MDHLWIVEEVEFATEPDPEQVAQLEISEYSNYQRAVSHGISSDYIAWRKEPGADYIEVRPLPSPDIKKDKH